ncbi:uncharacterized protein N7477_003035 [Penicillium maclennaniae]|uniref:uncharacterized protein n=1 Tax=Penicillium maclennaniae TaxID=1343394 RepID=UPI00253FD88D|nr:uncharacterized protein N7477_003035 [Penicillium maclennaniae]KAJ5677402.1 hypothetical protein N7477_003035 [Penicillium maclennaniae]
MLLRESLRQAPRAMGIFSPSRFAPSRRTLITTPIRLNSSQQQPSSYREGMERYKTFTRPFGKVFLGAVLVYQVIYWSWLKLEMDESKLEKNGILRLRYSAYITCTNETLEEMSALEKKARELAGSKK